MELFIILILSIYCWALRRDLNKKHVEFVQAVDKFIETKVDKEQLEKTAHQLIDELNVTKKELSEERDRNNTVISQKKSSEVRLGQITEHIVPF